MLSIVPVSSIHCGLWCHESSHTATTVPVRSPLVISS